VLQVLLLLATCGLIVVGIFQARAANVLATAARDQIAASDAQQKELLSQGSAARRPFFVVIPGGGGDHAWLNNVGQGIAFKTTWHFVDAARFGGLVKPESMGAMPVGNVRPLVIDVRAGGRSTVNLEQLRSQGGIRIEYEDSAGKRYFSVITRAPEGHTNVTDTGEIS
jgi:hypothetical protein